MNPTDDIKEFKISPAIMKISGYGSAQFECKFTPPEQDQFYYKIISGGVHWSEERPSIASYTYVPIPIQVRLLGKYITIYITLSSIIN